MGLNEADTRANLIDPKLFDRGWRELIRREVTAGAIEVIAGAARQRKSGRADYLLRVPVQPGREPVAVAVIEAKAEDLPPDHGIEQAKGYCRRLNVPFAFSSNGHLFVEYDCARERPSGRLPLDCFPTPDELRARYEAAMGFRLDDPAAAPLLAPYHGRGDDKRRYYQDAAIRAVFEKVTRAQKHGEPKRALLSLATGSGKTFIAVNLLRRVADAGQLRRALFVCDRDELRTQASAAFQECFGADAAIATAGNPQKNARVIICTYQTLGVDTDDGTASFLTEHFPEDYFSHIVIDECHRSAWGQWRAILDRNPNAVQIGLTATPRQLEVPEGSEAELAEDERLSADNYRYFGEPVYEYSVGQAIEDGYLAACEIVRRDVYLDMKASPESVTGVEQEDLQDKMLEDARTGQPLTWHEAAARYEATSFEARLVIPERVATMCADLFDQLVATGGPEQKTIVFCARDSHADMVAAQLGSLYAEWCAKRRKTPVRDYAFKCTAAGGSDHLVDLKGMATSHFVACTVDLLTTGVDVPEVRNIAFMRYLRSPILFMQMIGRGTRLAPGKLMFRVYDYTDATRLFGRDFRTRFPPVVDPTKPPVEAPDRPPNILVRGIDVKIVGNTHQIVTMVDGRPIAVEVDEYKRRLAEKIRNDVKTVDDLRHLWVEPKGRRAFMEHLPEAGRSAQLVQQLEGLEECDLFDVIARLTFRATPWKRVERKDVFLVKHEPWLGSLPPPSANTLRAIAGQFVSGGIDALESQELFAVPDVRAAGGVKALQAVGKPKDVLTRLKELLLAA